MKFILVVAFALVAVVYAGEETARTISQESDITPEGFYQYAFKTDNGINVKEQGAQKDLGDDKKSAVVQGSYSYKSPDGTDITVTYTADEDGYHPKGDHFPVSPPIPEYIIRALRYLEEHPPKEANAK